MDPKGYNINKSKNKSKIRIRQSLNHVQDLEFYRFRRAQ